MGEQARDRKSAECRDKVVQVPRAAIYACTGTECVAFMAGRNVTRMPEVGRQRVGCGLSKRKPASACLLDCRQNPMSTGGGTQERPELRRGDMLGGAAIDDATGGIVSDIHHTEPHRDSSVITAAL